MNIDANYDAAFVDNVDGSAPNHSNVDAIDGALPLLLVGKGQLGYSRTMAAPVAGGLGEGTQRDSTLGSWVAMTQSSWHGGALEVENTGTSERHFSAIADTRYAGRVTLPPKVYGPFALPGATPGSNVTLRWFKYDIYLYCVYGGKFYRATFDQNGVSGGAVVPNWAAFSTHSVFASATDIDLLEDAAAGYRASFIVLTGAGTAQYIHPTTAAVNTIGDTTRYITTLGFGSAAVMMRGAGPNAHVELIVGPVITGTAREVLPSGTGIAINNFLVVGGTQYAICNFGIYRYSTMPMPLHLAWGQYENQTIGRVATMWRGAGYIGSGEALLKFDGSSISNVGLNANPNTQVDSTISMTPRMLVGADDGLYVLTGEAGKRCAIWVMTSDSIWHCLYVSASASNQIYSIGYDNRVGRHSVSGLAVVQLQPRLWWSEDLNTYYIYVGRNTSGASAVSAALGGTYYRGYASSGEVVSSWQGGKYAALQKVFRGATITRSELSGAIGQNDVACDIEIDRSGVWLPMRLERWDKVQHVFATNGTVLSAGVTITSVSSRSTFDVSNVIGISAGVFIRVGKQVGQVQSVTGNTVTLVRSLRRTPIIGSSVSGARPVGYEYRYRVRLSTSDSNITPVVNRVSVDMAYELLDRERYSLYIRVEDGMQTRSGAMYGMNAETLRAKLSEWLCRPDPFWVLLADGTRALVRAMNANDSELKYQQVIGAGVVAPGSVVKIVLQEVEVS